MTPSKRDLDRRLDDLEGDGLEADEPDWMKQVPPEKRGNRTEAWRYYLNQGDRNDLEAQHRQ